MKTELFACLTVGTLFVGAAWADPTAQQGPETKAEADYRQYVLLTERASNDVGSVLEEISADWQPGSAAMLIESIRFARSPTARSQIIELLQKKTSQKFGRDLSAWYRWLWAQEFPPHPDYAKFKSAIYSRIDARFAEYFADTQNAKIRLDEIRWGGVRRDGIPPLKDPEMIAAEKATYLADTDVVFGVSLNGDTRCYPKRILAWHEMFKDTLGGEPLCGAY